MRYERYIFCDSWVNWYGDIVEEWYDEYEDEYIWKYYDSWGLIDVEYEFAK